MFVALIAVSTSGVMDLIVPEPCSIDEVTNGQERKLRGNLRTLQLLRSVDRGRGCHSVVCSPPYSRRDFSIFSGSSRQLVLPISFTSLSSVKPSIATFGMTVSLCLVGYQANSPTAMLMPTRTIKPNRDEAASHS